MTVKRRVTTAQSALPWHARPVDRVIADLKANARGGLSSDEAVRRLAAHGPNLLDSYQKFAWHEVLLRQLKDVLILILLVAAAVSLLVGDATDAVTILAIVALNAVLGFAQEWKAERALLGCVKCSVRHAR